MKCFEIYLYISACVFNYNNWDKRKKIQFIFKIIHHENKASKELVHLNTHSNMYSTHLVAKASTIYTDLAAG